MMGEDWRSAGVRGCSCSLSRDGGSPWLWSSEIGAFAIVGRGRPRSRRRWAMSRLSPAPGGRIGGGHCVMVLANAVGVIGALDVVGSIGRHGSEHQLGDRPTRLRGRIRFNSCGRGRQ